MAELETIPMNGTARAHRCVCGSAADECTCGALAAGFLRRGLDAAAAHRLREALANLQVCRALIPDDATSSEAAGLCSFAVGDVDTAADLWRVAASSNPTGPASAWLASLERGEIRAALIRYNDALAAAKNDDWTVADELSAGLRRDLPDFLPGIQLRALVLVALGRIEEGRKVLHAAKAAVSDDTATTAMLASLPPQTASSRRAPQGRAYAAAGAIVLLLAISTVVFMRRGSPDVVVQAQQPATVVPTNAASDQVPGPQEQQIAPASYEAGLQAYRLGRDLLENGQAAAAAAQLFTASAAPVTAYFHDDALYLLARASQENGDDEMATTAAAQLLAEHPSSIFANSYIRRLAAGTRPDE